MDNLMIIVIGGIIVCAGALVGGLLAKIFDWE